MKDLADRLAMMNAKGAMRGISHVSLYRYLDGELEPSLDVARALAEVLGVSVAWLVAGVGLPAPGGLTDHVRPLWSIDGPIGAAEPLDSPEKRAEAEASFGEGFKPFRPAWDELTPTVQVLFGNLLARRMMAARNLGEPWREPFWRGTVAAKLGTDLVGWVRWHDWADGPKPVTKLRKERTAALGTPEMSDLLIARIGWTLCEWRDRANPVTKTPTRTRRKGDA